MNVWKMLECCDISGYPACPLWLYGLLASWPPGLLAPGLPASWPLDLLAFFPFGLTVPYSILVSRGFWPSIGDTRYLIGLDLPLGFLAL